jgi:PAS domain S-box-containing protein
MAGSPPATILVVDDNPATRYSTSRVLRAEGFIVVEATTGNEALERAWDQPDLIVLDVNLPDIDGLQVCRLLRADARTARTPVIHLSATFVAVSDQVQGFEAGADGYITHPVEPPVLVATVNAFLRTRRAEDAMRASEAKFKAVFDRALNAIALFDEDFMFLEVNPAFCHTLDRPCEEVVGRRVRDFLAGRDPLPEINRALEANGEWRGVFSLARADGWPIHLEWSVSIHSVPGTRLGIATDITERKAIEADRERLLTSEQLARAEAERANNTKDEFLAALSHELRTPLNAIVGWADVLKRRILGTDPEALRAIEAIQRNARVQTQLIADLLDVSRITSGKLTLEREWFDPRETIEVSVGALTATAKARNIHIQTDLEQVPQILWDQARFQQVIWNLLENAVKFSTAGSTIAVRLVSSPTGVDISVADQGRGISAEFLPHIFERFRQEDSSTTRGHGGLGLGLAIVKQLVEAHGASVSVESGGPKMGATFRVHIPFSSEPRPSSPSAAGDHRHQLAGVRVLVVEDDGDARVLVGQLFREAQAEVQEVADVRSALAALDTFAPQLVVSDVGMPDQDGYELIRQIREGGRDAATLPAIALTAFAREEDSVKAMRSGYQRHIGKPVDASLLLRAAAELTARAPRS